MTKDWFLGRLILGQSCSRQASCGAAGRAQLIEERHGKHLTIQDIRVNGELAATFQMACARCLEAVSQKLAHKFDLLYRPLGSDAGKEELSVTAVEAEISYYEGDGLLLEERPARAGSPGGSPKGYLPEDCKGLCPHCGKNLNLAQCSCEEPVEDLRWSGLKEIRSKLAPGS